MTNHQRSFSCITCNTKSRSDAKYLHCWMHKQCRNCHYFGIVPKGRISIKWEGKPKHQKIEHHNSIITYKNIELYCKLSKIIRNKPCRSKKLVLMAQEKHRIVLP